MSCLSVRFVPVLRSISPSIRKVLFPCSSTQRSYWRRRGDAFSDLSTAMQSVENYMKEMDKEMNRLFAASPVRLPRFPSPFNVGSVREVPVVSTADGKSYKLELDMQDMEPENINITLKNNELTVTSRLDEKREDGARFVRENTYHYVLPKEINPDTIRSTLANGVLTIEAPLPTPEAKEIPLNIQSGQNSISDGDSGKK